MLSVPENDIPLVDFHTASLNLNFHVNKMFLLPFLVERAKCLLLSSGFQSINSSPIGA